MGQANDKALAGSPAPRRIKLRARVIPYSSIVGGGLVLANDQGNAMFQVALLGTANGITKAQSDDMAHQLAFLINELGLDVPDA